MSLVCSVIFIHHAFNANILDKDYAFSDGEILMVDNAVRTHFEPYERHFKEIGFTENTIKKYLQCTNIQTVTVPVPAKFLRASNVPTGLLNEMIAYLNSEERNHHNFSELLLFSCLSIKLPNNVVMPVHLILFMRSANISATVRREFLRSTVVKVTRV